MKRYDSYKDSGVQWIGEIPSHWGTTSLKHLLRGIQDGTHGTYKRVDSSPYLLLSAKNVFEDGLHLSETESAISEEDYNQIVSNGYPQKGDIAICCVGTIGRCCIYGESKPFAFQRSVTFLRSKDTSDAKYILYLLRSQVAYSQYSILAKTTAQSGLYMGALSSLDITFPPIKEQTAIANYLDNKCSKIDNIIATQEKRVELLRELKQSIITRAVTHGINPDAKMKDSGVEWIGEIPEHWDVMPIKRLSRIQTGTTPSTKVPEYFEPEEIKWFSPSDVTDDLVMTSASRFVSNKAKDDGACRMFPPKSIYFVGIGATIGKVGVCDEEASSNQQINALMVNKKANYKYLAYILRCQKDEIYLSANVVTLPIINQEKTGELLSPVPPIEEQELIVTYIEQQTSRLDSSITKALRQIELLKEYKQSLITEVVTGKRKVI